MMTVVIQKQPGYGVMGCTDEQRVLFSSFLMEDRAKDWWDAVERRYPDGITWDQFQQEFIDRFFPQSHKDSKKLRSSSS